MLATVIALLIFGDAYVTGHSVIDPFTNTINMLGILLPIYHLSKMLTFKDVTIEEKLKVLVYSPLFPAATVLWSLEEQDLSILALFTNEQMQASLFGFPIVANRFQSLNPVLVVILAPIFATLWAKLGEY